MENRLESVCTLLFRVLQDRSEEVSVEVMLAFSTLVVMMPGAYGAFAAPLLAGIRVAFAAELPALLGAAAFALGDLYRALGSRVRKFADDEVEELVGLLERPSARDEVANVLKGMADVVGGVGDGAMAARFWEVAIVFGNREIDAGKKGELVYTANVFEGVARLIRAVIVVVRQEGRNVEIEREVKKRVFPIIERICELQAFSDGTL
jgi:hypothetical protein